MKTAFCISLLLLLGSCSLLLPNLMNGTVGEDNDLDGVILINEVSADHPTADDWIELYNTGEVGYDLAGFYLTDDPSDITKWSFPDGTYIRAGSYLVVTCSANGDREQAAFSLKPGIEPLIFTSPDLTIIVDDLGGIAASGTGSYGRASDGEGNWVIFETATPGGANS